MLQLLYLLQNHQHLEKYKRRERYINRQGERSQLLYEFRARKTHTQTKMIRYPPGEGSTADLDKAKATIFEGLKTAETTFVSP